MRMAFPAVATSTQVPPLIPREVLFGNPRYARLRISPDGTRIAYLAPDDRDVLQVWIRTIGERDDRAVTADRPSGWPATPGVAASTANPDQGMGRYDLGIDSGAGAPAWAG